MVEHFYWSIWSTDDDTMTLGHGQNERALALIASNSY